MFINIHINTLGLVGFFFDVEDSYLSYIKIHFLTNEFTILLQLLTSEITIFWENLNVTVSWV